MMERGRERGERGGGVRETYRERKRAAEMKRGIAWRASLHRCARAAKPTRMPSLSYTVFTSIGRDPPHARRNLRPLFIALFPFHIDMHWAEIGKRKNYIERSNK
jgi:hypothetical protein